METAKVLTNFPTNEERSALAKCLRGGYDIVSDDAGHYWLNGALFGLDICARSEETIRYGLNKIADYIEPLAPVTCNYEPDSKYWYFDDSGIEIETNDPSEDCCAFECDICGYPMMFSSEGEQTNFEPDPPYTPYFNYCPNCGAKVMKP